MFLLHIGAIKVEAGNLKNNSSSITATPTITLEEKCPLQEPINNFDFADLYGNFYCNHIPYEMHF